MTYNESTWHRECFRCTNCAKILADEKFTPHDDKPYCVPCFGQLFAKKCEFCTKPITGACALAASFAARAKHMATCYVSVRLFVTLCLCPSCSCSYHFFSLCQLTTLTIRNSVSLSLPAQDLPLSQILPTIDSLPASGLTPRTSLRTVSSEHLRFMFVLVSSLFFFVWFRAAD